MEAFALYLFKSSVWLTGFALVYMLFLRNERFFTLIRYYLVSGMLFSMIFPLFTWHFTVLLPLVPSVEISDPQVQGIVIPEESFNPQNLILLAYLAGIFYLAFRILRQTLPVFRIIRKSEKRLYSSAKLIRTDAYPASFSFFSFVFVNPSIDETETNEIVNHELEHIRQQHWIDLLLFEILRTMQWFNPVSWLYGHLIRQNHEYLADERALRRSSNPAIYRAALLNQLFGGPVISLANSFNYSLNKKRFKMMKQTISSPIRKLKLLMVLPLIAGVFYAFAAPEYKVIQCSNNTETQQVIPEGKTVTGKVVTEDGKALKGASVIISGTTIGTITDANGSFKLIMTDNSPIVVSFVGFQSKKVQPDFEKPMDIKLDAVMINLDKVTVVGYGNTPPPPPPFDKKNPPLFMLDGKSIEESEMDKISPDKIESIDVLKGESAKATYGEKGKNGVILIKTKKNSTSSGKESGTNLNGNFVITPSKDNAQSTSGLNFTAKNIQGDFKNGTTEIKGDSIFADFSKTNSLLFIDGKEATKAEVNRLNPDKIESVNVLKDDFAVKKYGEKGKNGAIEITLKKTDSVSPPPPPSGKDNSVRNDKPIFIIVEEIPEYPGGTNALRDFIAKHVKYPAEAQKDKAQGTVYVNFVVTSNGKIGDTKVIRSVHPALDQEAIRVIKSLPDWKPGYQRGKAVDVAFTFPIDFILQ